MKLTLEGSEVQKYFDCEENYNQLEAERNELLGLVDDLSAKVKELEQKLRVVVLPTPEGKSPKISARLKRDIGIAKDTETYKPFSERTKPKVIQEKDIPHIHTITKSGRWSAEDLSYLKDVIFKPGKYSGAARSISTVAAMTGRSYDSIIAKVYTLGGKVSHNKIKLPGV